MSITPRRPAGRRPWPPRRPGRSVTVSATSAAVAATAVVAAGLGLVAVTRAGGDPAAPDRPAEVADATDVLEAEIDQMLDEGLAADHPKVAALQDDLAALEAGAATRAAASAETDGGTDADLSDILGPPHRGARQPGETATGRRGETVWDQGRVDCEPIPPDRLTWDEVAEAACVSIPRADGSSRYVAVTPDGTVRVVRFASDGSVTRQPDRQVDLEGRAPHDLDLHGNAAGDLVVGEAGTPGVMATVDLG